MEAFNRHISRKSLSLVPKTAAIKPLHALSLQKSTGFLFEETLSNPNPLSVHMAFISNSSTNSGEATTGQTSALQVRRATGSSGAIPAFGPALPSTGFETPPQLAILFKPFQFLKSLCLNSVGLGFDSVAFHSGWELVVWKPNLSELDLHVGDLMEICGGSVENETLEVCEPQMELSVENPADLGEPPIEVPGVVPTVVVEEEEDSSVEILASGKKMKRD